MNKIIPMDKNTKRGFTDVYTPKKDEHEYLLRQYEQIIILKEELVQLKIERHKADDEKNYKQRRIIGNEIEKRKSKISKWSRHLKVQVNRDNIMVTKLQACVSREVFLECSVRANAEYKELIKQIPGIFN